MNSNMNKSVSNEQETQAVNGWMMVLVNFVLVLGAVLWFITIVRGVQQTHENSGFWWLIPDLLIGITAAIFTGGYFTLQPNEARVLILFGAYKGTVRASGFWWANPFYTHNAKVPITGAEFQQRQAQGQ